MTQAEKFIERVDNEINNNYDKDIVDKLLTFRDRKNTDITKMKQWTDKWEKALDEVRMANRLIQQMDKERYLDAAILAYPRNK